MARSTFFSIYVCIDYASFCFYDHFCTVLKIQKRQILNIDYWEFKVKYSRRFFMDNICHTCIYYVNKYDTFSFIEIFLKTVWKSHFYTFSNNQYYEMSYCYFRYDIFTNFIDHISSHTVVLHNRNIFSMPLNIGSSQKVMKDILNLELSIFKPP